MSEDVDLRKLVADRAIAYFTDIRVAPSEIPAVIRRIARALKPVDDAPVEVSPKPSARPRLSPPQIRKSITPDALISFEDDQPDKTLTQAIAATGLSPDDYRSKWGLPEDHPVAAASSREALGRSAKAAESRPRAALAAAALQPLAGAPQAAPEPEIPLQPTSNPAPAAPATASVAADVPMRQGRPGLGPGRKTLSSPAAFRPKDAVHDPETSARHKRWLAMLSETDWARIRAVARQVNPAHVPPVLSELSAPLRVRACLVGQEARFPGEHVGTLRGGQVAVLISEAGEG